jgi:hypothetical protein
MERDSKKMTDFVKRDPRQALLDRVDNDFVYHAPKPGQVERYAVIREQARLFARMLVLEVPPSRELSLALTNLEQAVFHANAGIARNE